MREQSRQRLGQRRVAGQACAQRLDAVEDVFTDRASGRRAAVFGARGSNFYANIMNGCALGVETVDQARQDHLHARGDGGSGYMQNENILLKIRDCYRIL